MPSLVGADTAAGAGPIPSAQDRFAGGERAGYDREARAIVAAQAAPLEIFLRRGGIGPGIRAGRARPIADSRCPPRPP
jgi:hypothetical protein